MFSFFRKFLSFPEYSDYLHAMSELNSKEKQMSQAIKAAFDALPGYNAMQKFELHDTYERITSCGVRLTKIMKNNQKNLEPYKDAYTTLTSIQSETAKWTTMRDNIKISADKSQAEADRAQQYLEKMRQSGCQEAQIQEAESSYDTAKRKAKMDFDSFNDTNKRVKEAVKPFQKEFLDEFRDTTINYLDQRIQCAKEIKELCIEFDEATNSFSDYDDGRNESYKEFINELEEEEKKIFGEVLPISNDYSD
ncbi:hypothetical protein M9Y10_002779 [Tritrichomonas musculus]|uniref:Sorting nexin/Vps5-like C-terminal domain-containing protein n=1 Tax=Tritrichomonas musculus TaxID=1915356 RepID=A0ABR2LC54_9EUKA